MSEKKPIPAGPESNPGSLCPVCGKRSYSRGGIHPQCAVLRADAPRKKELDRKKKARAAAKAKLNG